MNSPYFGVQASSDLAPTLTAIHLEKRWSGFLLAFLLEQALSLYLLQSLESMVSNLNQLGKHKTGKNCIYITKLTDIDEKILRKMIRETYQLLTKNSEIRK